MSYITTGIEPNRVFIVQWQNMQTLGTSRLNFQIKLHEQNNQIDFCYGSAIRGLYFGQGGLIGIKDHLGGPYRFYNFKHLSSFSNSVDYFSINEWPGPDSAFVIRTRSSSQYKEEINNKPVLLNLFPNPFNSKIKIKFSIPAYQTSKINISVFDALGRKVKSLFNGEVDDGFYEINWDGTNSSNRSVSSGVYFIVLDHKKNKKIKKAILLR